MQILKINANVCRDSERGTRNLQKCRVMDGSIGSEKAYLETVIVAVLCPQFLTRNRPETSAVLRHRLTFAP